MNAKDAEMPPVLIAIVVGFALSTLVLTALLFRRDPDSRDQDPQGVQQGRSAADNAGGGGD